MNHTQKIEKLKTFADEREFRSFLMDILKRMGFKNVQETHRYGAPEYGKDIIASFVHELDDTEWYAFVVKKGRILGGTDIIENIKNQIKQCFEYPYQSVEGNEVKINKVRIVNNENISRGATDAIGKSPELKSHSNYKFWWNEKLIEHIDKFYPDFWLPGDFLSKEYKKAVVNSIRTEFEIKELSVTKLSDTRVRKLMDLFITPRLMEISPVRDPRIRKKLKRTRVNIEDIIESKDHFLIEGDPGSGKSRLVNKLVCDLLEPSRMTKQKLFPVKAKLPNLRKNNFDIEKSIRNEFCHLIPDEVDFVDFEQFSFVVFLDSVDDLYKEELQMLSKQVKSLIKSHKYRFIITVRSLENINFEKTSRKIRKIYLENFNAKQIERFVLRYFDDLNRGQRLINVLKESNILEKLPTTPLTITLVSLLYEDTDYEIPATLTDIYNDFVSILLGKLEVKAKTQLIDLELKKRVFSYIAYRMLEKKEFEINKGEFSKRIQSYLSPKGIKLAEEEDVLRLIGNSGILYIDHNEMVGFKHLSFLEYFASFEIFFVNNNYDQLINNFNDVNWQNAAIFYAGISKDMPWFIEKLINGIPNEALRDWLLNVGGMGYLSQALYMTDVDDRVKLINKSLDNMVLAFRRLKNLTRELGPYYKMPLHIIGAILVFWFNMNFRSVTLAHCLEKLYEDYLKSNANSLGEGNFEIAFKLFLISTTLASEYLNRYEKLNDLIERDCFLKDPVLVVLGDMFLDIQEIDKEYVGDEKRKKIKNEIKRFKKLLVSITREPAYRFGDDYKKMSKRIGAPK